MYIGLLLSSLALHMAAPAQRMVPEPLQFAVSLLQDAAGTEGEAAQAFPLTAPPSLGGKQWLRPSLKAKKAASAGPLQLERVLGLAPEDEFFQSDEFRCKKLPCWSGLLLCCESPVRNACPQIRGVLCWL